MNNLLIAIPTKDNIVAGLVPKLIKWAKMGASIMIFESSPLVDYARNKIVRHFLTTDKEYLLFIDSDTIPEIDGPERLLAHKKEVVSGLYNLVMNGKDSLVSRPSCFTLVLPGKSLTDAVPVQPKTGLQRVVIASGGYLLIHRSVFSLVKKPWFEYEYLDAVHDAYKGEDVVFSNRVEKAGIQIWCDTDVLAGHHKQFVI
jgi:hypothetical protein